MRNTPKVFRSSIYLIFTLFCLNGCTSPGTNDVKNDQNEKNSPKVDTVLIKEMKFNPAELHVKLGDTVVWMNDDLVDHNVTSYRDKILFSDTLKVGNSWKWVVTDSAAYYCSIHPTMTGKILIQ